MTGYPPELHSPSMFARIIGALLLFVALLVVYGVIHDFSGLPFFLQEGIFALATLANIGLQIGYLGPEKGHNRGIVERETVIDGETKSPHDDLKEVLRELFDDERQSLGHGLNVYELGCGRGGLSSSLNQLPGISCFCLDGYKGIRSLGDHYISHDLGTPLDFKDLAPPDFTIAIEVGEHVPPEKQATFFGTLLQAKKGIVVSWARPGQGGHGHVNEQLPGDIQSRIEKLSDFRLCTKQTTLFRNRQTKRTGIHQMILRMNLMVFLRDHADVDRQRLCDGPLGHWLLFDNPWNLVGLLVAACGCVLCGFRGLHAWSRHKHEL